jgi:hypothetical protein
MSYRCQSCRLARGWNSRRRALTTLKAYGLPCRASPGVTWLAARRDGRTSARPRSVRPCRLGHCNASIAILSYRRDRPHLKTTWAASVNSGQPELAATVVNDGRHPVSLADVALRTWGDGPPRWKVKLAVRWPRLGPRLKVSGASWGYQPSRGRLTQAVLLAPGASHTCHFGAHELRSLVVDGPDRIFIEATDTLGRCARQLLHPDAAEFVAREWPGGDSP